MVELAKLAEMNWQWALDAARGGDPVNLLEMLRVHAKIPEGVMDYLDGVLMAHVVPSKRGAAARFRTPTQRIDLLMQYEAYTLLRRAHVPGYERALIPMLAEKHHSSKARINAALKLARQEQKARAQSRIRRKDETT